MISTPWPWRGGVEDRGVGLAHAGGAGGVLWALLGYLAQIWPPPKGFSQPWPSRGSCVSDACPLLPVLGERAGLMYPAFVRSVQRNRTTGCGDT